MTAPLDDILVVSIEQAVAAPYCSARLREAGARVIKIERPGGDFARGYDSVAGGDSSYFFWLNQGKESLVLDFKQSQDAALLQRILAKADVLIQNLAPGALARAGFDLDQLRQQYPSLITCDISGYGHGEEVAGLKAYDFLVQAESGLVSISGGENELGRIGISVCDIGAGMTAHAGILEALLERNRTGRGSAVEVSLFGVAADWMTVPLLHYDYGGKAPSRAGLNHPSIAPYGGYLTKNGETVIIAIQNEREWRRFCEIVLDLPAQSDAEAFCSNQQRVTNREALDEMINSVTQTLDRAALTGRLQSADISFGSVNSVEGFSNHPALQRRQANSSSGLSVKFPVRPVGVSTEHTSAPEIGQHSAVIRAEFGS
ncbi:MAG: CaiB/BaiF CoA-transferase family protein [Gammaproteobacteria bacterium]